jgi:hypothetical protein
MRLSTIIYGTTGVIIFIAIVTKTDLIKQLVSKVKGTPAPKVKKGYYDYYDYGDVMNDGYGYDGYDLDFDECGYFYPIMIPGPVTMPLSLHSTASSSKRDLRRRTEKR